MTRPRLCVLGASGLLGRWVAFLARETWDVCGTYYRHPLPLPGVSMYRLDIRDGAEVRAFLRAQRPHVLVHTAVFIGREPTMRDVIVGGVEHVARALEGTATRLIYLSTDLVFDGEKGNYSEDDPPHPIMPYGRDKAESEAIVLARVADAVVVRTSLLCHLNPPDPRTQWMLDRIEQGDPPTLFVDEYRSPLWVTDLAAALMELAGSSYRGILHLAGPQPLSRYDLGTRLLAALGVPADAVRAGRSRESGMVRPLDTTLDSRRAYGLLRTRIRSIDEGLQDPPGRGARAVLAL